MDDIISPHPPDRLIKPLQRSQTQIAAGETVPLETFLDELRDSISRMEARRTIKSADKYQPRDPSQPASAAKITQSPSHPVTQLK